MLVTVGFLTVFSGYVCTNGYAYGAVVFLTRDERGALSAISFGC